MREEGLEVGNSLGRKRSAMASGSISDLLLLVGVCFGVFPSGEEDSSLLPDKSAAAAAAAAEEEAEAGALLSTVDSFDKRRPARKSRKSNFPL